MHNASEKPDRSAWLERLLAVEAERHSGPLPDAESSQAATTDGAGEPDLSQLTPAEQPAQIGRYRIDKALAQGAFGTVYLASDDDLRRKVAVKVPHRRVLRRPEDVGLYLAEAQTVAGLDHPNIVPVYDVGQTDDGLCYIVSKFIEGSDLAKAVRAALPSHGEAAELVAAVAAALHHAHLRRVVHRDIKPANILIDTQGRPYLADFGLALREECFGGGRGWAGTVAYMSPEQARGEAHLVDGRSDIFSLGLVFYELLTAARPFRGETVEETIEQIKTVEARPPRQIDDSIPKELERICLKALAKRASDRYTTALDMADDLRHFLASLPQAGAAGQPARRPPAPGAEPAAATLDSDSVRPIHVVPKGLRSFDAQDADFFLELLPGARDRNGLPEGIRFWKHRIEEPDADRTFRVGLIYGPSGCGKSSLVKAGLLPRLAPHVIAVYVEAAAEATEARLLRGLCRHCPGLPETLTLKDALAAVRRGQALPSGRKVLVILDQFEQWLHANGPYENSELVEALRQCDGEHVQCLLMVRDDFAMAVTRFMRELEIPQVEGDNVAPVDLFDRRHAQKVLAAFGRALGALPEHARDLSPPQKAFLEQAVAGLAEDGKVVCVRLALFAEMVKGKAWTPTTLRQAGGAEGVGVAFLEETLGSGAATPERRVYQKAAQAVLHALLPEQGSDIKGHMRPREELLAASGLARAADFDGLLRILDGELRLVTPTDPEGPVAAAGPESPARVQYYQLTHDYLVPALREWLTRKQSETRRGRAALRLEERAALWNAKPENGRLPAWWQWADMRLFTRPKDWTPPQRQMMRAATRYHAVRSALAAVLLLAAVVTGDQVYRAIRAEALVESIVRADTAEVLPLIQRLARYRRWADPRLEEHLRASPPDSKEHLHASLALLPVDGGQADYLCDRLLRAEPQELGVLLKALAPHRDDLGPRLWAAAEAPPGGDEGQRLRAACALAAYDPQNPRWDAIAPPVAEQLVTLNPVFLGTWLEHLRPVRARLLAPLTQVFRDHDEERASQRTLATNILAEYAADRPEWLAELVMEADDRQFAVMFPELKEHGARGLPVLEAEVRKPLPREGEAEKERLAERQAGAAIALMKLARAQAVWPLLRHSADPRVRSWLIHRGPALGVDWRDILKRWREETDISARRALLLCLGEFSDKEFPAEDRRALVPEMRDLYARDSDPGIHAALEWLLRQWGKGDDLKAVERPLATGKVEGNRRWYVARQGHTFAVLDGGLAIATKEVTVEQFLRFREEHHYNPQYAPKVECPVNWVTWYDAVAYCNWLSGQEGIAEAEWCYEPNAEGRYAAGMKVKANFRRLAGYRLPTEAEWESACRAGAVTSRYYGETERLLGKYAWYTKGPSDRWLTAVGSVKPNDWGLFDMLGNAQEWCHDREVPPAGPATPEAEEPAEEIADPVNRVIRGGSFLPGPAALTATYRDEGRPSDRGSDVSFRPVRTCGR